MGFTFAAGAGITYGTANADNMYGRYANDTLYGNDGNDTLNGGTGNNLLDGGNGNDVIYGGDGNDTLVGGAGYDKLYGGNGSDKLDGGDGGGILSGGTGSDTLIGGSGADTFLFERANGWDTVKNYKVGYDHLEFFHISGKEVSIADAPDWNADGRPDGTLVYYGGLGGQGVDHGTVYLEGVSLSSLSTKDYAFT